MLGIFFFFRICFITSEGYYSNVSVVLDLYSAYFFFFHIYYIFFCFHIHVLLILVLTSFILSIVGNVRQKILFLYHTQQLQCFFDVVQAPHKCIAVHLVMKLPLYVPKTMKFKVPSVDKVTKRFVKGLINHLKDCHCNVC